MTTTTTVMTVEERISHLENEVARMKKMLHYTAQHLGVMSGRAGLKPITAELADLKEEVTGA